MKTRKINRIALLQEYRNRPETLETYIPEVAQKGYTSICFAGGLGDEEKISKLAKAAEKYELEVSVFTWFMKYQNVYLKNQPNQVMKFAGETAGADQDKLTLVWGCPFNIDFQKRYFEFLDKIAKISNVKEIWVNDEAYLGISHKQFGCYCNSCRNSWKNEFGTEMPEPPFENKNEFEQLINWRFDRWNQVHGEMRTICNRHHKVRTIFATSPVTFATIESWITSVDLGRMIEHIDGILTDPYYTFHLAWGAGPYVPIEVYLTESCRIISSFAGTEKYGLICAQSFSHPTFSRPLEAKDGYWAGTLPLAAGIDSITTYTYPLMKAAETVQKAYEDTFRLDKYFEQTKPVKFAGIVYSTESQPYVMGLQSSPDWATSWFSTVILPISEIFRHNGLPYTYLPSNQIENKDLSDYPVILMPRVASLNKCQKKSLTNYVQSGGLLIAFGETATVSDGCENWDKTFMEKVFGLTSMKKLNHSEELKSAGIDELFQQLPWPDKITAGYMDGQYTPAVSLSKITEIAVHNKTEILAIFKNLGTPAITKNIFGNGTAIYVGGIPDRLFSNKELTVSVRNYAQLLIRKIIAQIVPENLPLRIKNFPPEVPIAKVRPLDPRNLPTFEFLPCAGENILIATIASYFREPAKFTIEAYLPKVKECFEICELISGTIIKDFQYHENKIEFSFDISCDDFLKVYAFLLK